MFLYLSTLPNKAKEFLYAYKESCLGFYGMDVFIELPSLDKLPSNAEELLSTCEVTWPGCCVVGVFMGLPSPIDC